jgi:IS30 family transposase
LHAYGVDDPRRVEDFLDNPPRKSLRWATPATAFAARLPQ